MNPVDFSRVSDELWDKTLGKLNDPRESVKMSYEDKIRWIHLIDAVSRGYATPAEAWDAVRLGYVPEHLTVRESKYQHLLRYL